MDHKVDLDELATRLERARAEWERTARVGPLTWRDEQAPWPQPIVHERCAVAVPESVGVVLRRGEDEAEFVVWTGGWADIGMLLDGEVWDLYAEFHDVSGAYAAVARNVEDFLA
ncbi:hypothetical protein [Phycicoccus jejuensis]|uniref:hypothetical protein n=1 Tax=Phycicoccus jejuensis TaxID=367299 RepID=UPI0012F9EF43|nr:hypothetical protein [Phycicoccus jejuensis]